MIGPSIKKEETKFRHPIEPQRRLLVTLRFLATGDSYGSLSYTFKVSKQLISKIIPEVCKELTNVLKDYLKVSKIKNKSNHKSVGIIIKYLNQITLFSDVSHLLTGKLFLQCC